ncbi:MAG: hypothetical protein Rubg2KO_13800 [Rubricoccaceae bacterium]
METATATADRLTEAARMAGRLSERILTVPRFFEIAATMDDVISLVEASASPIVLAHSRSLRL